MALKPDREIIETSIEYFMFTTGTRGGIVVAASGTGGWPTGPAMDSADRRVKYPTVSSLNISGEKPIGLLLNDFVNIDQSRQQLNPYKLEEQVGGKAYLLKKGWVVTNNIAAGEASGIAVPANAYMGESGNLYTTVGYSTASGYPKVGQFTTNVDSDGYATLQVDLPQ